MPQQLTDYFQTNITLLKKHHPETWNLMTSSAIEPLGIVFPATNGSPSLKVLHENNGTEIYIHDIHQPENDAFYFLNKITENYTGFVGVLGMGLGYGPMALLQERPHLQSLAVYELEPGIFLQALRHINLATFLADPRLILSIGPNANISTVMAPASRTLLLETSTLLFHQQSQNLNQQGYKELHDNLFSHINGLNIGGSTTKLLGETFLSTRLKHTTTMHHNLLLEQLQDSFKDVPAIMVAGGPSLDKNIHLLAQAQEHAVIIAVDTILPTLLQYGVRPHFLTSIDTNNLTYEKFADVIPQAKDISLICSSWVNPKTVNIFPALQTFWTFTQNPMESWLNTLLGGQLLTGGATTVAHLNLIAAQILGCDPIIFLGQDLAFPAKASHANGTILQGYTPTTNKKNLTTGETVKGIDGTILQTSRAFLSMKKHFEQIISQSDNTFINASEGGADIIGTQILSLQETLSKYCQVDRGIITKIKEGILESAPPNPIIMLQEFQKIINQAKILRKDIDKADKKSIAALAKLKKLKQEKIVPHGFAMLPKPLQKILNEIETIHNKLDNATLIWKLLEEITMNALQESERQKQAISLLSDNPQKYIEWLIKNIQRLFTVNKTRKECLALLKDHLNNVISFHKQESSCLGEIEQGIEVGRNRLKLARLYMDGGNYSLAKPILNELSQATPQEPQVYFYLGCIAAQRAEHDAKTKYFSKALDLDPNLATEIDAFHQNLGDEFLGYATYFKTQPGRQPSVKYMINKGLRYAPTHAKLLAEQTEALQTDLETIQNLLETKNEFEATPLIEEWHNHLVNNDNFRLNLPPERVGEIIMNYGRLLLTEQKQAEAVACFHEAMEYTPDSPRLHTLLIDTLFSMGSFNDAIEALNKAIAVDNEFAAYWEIIGDSLESDGQHDDAILAYERCFMSLPNNIGLLKKIGDCYRSSNQMEAAQAAYQQLKDKMQKLDTTNDTIQ